MFFVSSVGAGPLAGNDEITGIRDMTTNKHGPHARPVWTNPANDSLKS